MPKTNEMLLKLEVFHYAKSLNLNMGYYHIQLSINESNFCKIVIHWGGYWYNHLPMGVANFPYILQQKMNDLFRGFEFIRAYIYDFLIPTKGYWNDHVHKLELTLNKLKGKGLKCNIEKYFFRQTKMEYLVFWVTRYGVKPINRKIETMTNMKPPTQLK